MARYDFWMVPNLKIHLKVFRFQIFITLRRDGVEYHSKRTFPHVFGQSKEWWAKCVGTRGAYLEGH